MRLSAATKTVALAAFVGLCFSTTAHAQVIAGNPVNGTLGGNNPYSYSIGAESFSLADAYDITSLAHFGWHNPNQPQPGSIDWYLYADDSGQPGTILYSGLGSAYMSSVLFQNNPYDITKYQISLTGVTLGAGNYWVGFQNETSAYDPHWDITSWSGSSMDSFDGGTSWGEQPFDFAFEVQGQAVVATPEPASLLLLATGSVLVGVVARRRRAKQA